VLQEIAEGLTGSLLRDLIATRGDLIATRGDLIATRVTGPLAMGSSSLPPDDERPCPNRPAPATSTRTAWPR
jgi:hypothetical protein